MSWLIWFNREVFLHFDPEVNVGVGDGEEVNYLSGT